MTAPPGLELGQTEDPAGVVPGSPAALRAVVRQLREEARRLAGLRDRLAQVGTAGWLDGAALDAYRERAAADLAAWDEQLDVLALAGDALERYAGALVGGQADAARAIALHRQAADVTAQAQRDHQREVADYLDSIANPPLGIPQVGPRPPGPFHDPGDPLRAEAQRIVVAARAAVDDAGDAAVAALGNLPGARFVLTEQEAGHEWRWNGSAAATTAFERPQGTHPTRPLGEHAPAAEWLLVDGEGAAWLRRDLGTFEDHVGLVRLSAEQEALRDAVRGGLRFGLDEAGPVAGVDGAIVREAMEGSAAVEAGPLRHGVAWEGLTGGSVDAHLRGGPFGLSGGAEAFVGGRVGVETSSSVAGIGGTLGAEAWVGVGAAAEADVGIDEDGRLALGYSVGLGVGVGGEVSGGLTLDLDELQEAAEELEEWRGW